MQTKIYFIESSSNFDFTDLNSPHIAGSEKTLINISLELSKNKNLLIKVFNKSENLRNLENLIWSNINNINSLDVPDYLIAMSDANLLSKINCKKKFLWSHSVQPIEKFIRKKQLFPFLINKPILLLEGMYHFKTRSFLTSIFGKKILPIATDYDFINTNVNKDFIPFKRAIFTTRSDRNLNFLLECWKEIKKKSPDAELYINPPYDLSMEDKKNNIFLRKKGNKNDLIQDLLNSRVMLNPGHKGEVFCLAAEEARELCLPLITMGYGSLYERVEHDITGYLAKNKEEFINYASQILNDDTIYLNLKKKLYQKRNFRSYKNVAVDLLKILNES
ncbi:glycosyltransferase [Candidatus Pelagibacter sp. HIMB1623]|uniref:glycosyltransferase n=1 Tax=Candidatus Pelagibacter sp. HIMB1623 TaxID=3413358 RepID=UPI003F877D20